MKKNMPDVIFVPYPKRKRKSKKVLKEKSRTWWKKKCIARAKLIARRPHKCDWCGRTSGMMHGAHVITVAREGTCADPDNIMCLCYVCHFYKWHKSPHDAAQWFDATYPGRYKRLRKKADSGEKYSTEYWKSLYVELCKK
jgi:hypothetical protein